MKCPHCNADTKVISTRDRIFRTRRCFGPGRHTTYTTEYTREEIKAMRQSIVHLARIKALLRELEA